MPRASTPDTRGGGLVRVRLDLGYDGTDFSGWAPQPSRRTVAGVLAEALATVCRVPVAELGLVVAGRTDAGVHATGQVCHLDLPAAAWADLPGRSTLDPAAALLRRLHGVLPADVRVHAAAPAAAGFDARFSALRRHYRYRVSDDPVGVPPLRRRDVLWHRRPLDVAAMDAAASALVGLRDFAAFCRPREGATTVRTLLEYRWHRQAEGLLEARVSADAFCHSMVRALVGAVLPVGEGRREVDWPARVLARAVRDPAVGVVPAHGLTLVAVDYPPPEELAARAVEARARRGPVEPVADEQGEYRPVTFANCGDVRGPFYHGTRFELAPGQELVTGHPSHYQAGRVLHHLYFTALVPTAAWGAQLAEALTGSGGRGHIYLVEPTGPFEDDPNVTDKRFPGNPTASYRTRHPLRVVAELADWQGHDAAAVATMLDGLARLRAQGLDVILD